MVSRFTLLAPWWARWLANAAASSATLAVVAAAMFPRFPTAAAWPWNAVAVVAAGVTFAAGQIITQQPMRRTYAAALAGLDRPQQNLALAALRRNDIPPILPYWRQRSGLPTCRWLPSNESRRHRKQSDGGCPRFTP